MIKLKLGDISKSGTTSEKKYWEIKAGAGSIHDSMQKYLAAQGFSGHPRDAFRAWAASVGSSKGSLYDCLKNYYDKTTTP